MNITYEITECKIVKLLMDFEGIPDRKHTFSFGMRLEVMPQADDAPKGDIITVEISYAEKNSEPILSAKLCCFVKLPNGLTNEQKKEILTYEVAPNLYEELRRFVEDTMINSNTAFIDYIPYADEIDIWNDVDTFTM